MKIIYAEDDEDLRELFAMKIQSLSGAEILEHESGNEVIKTLEKEQDFPLIISDFNMDDGDASVIYKYIKENNINIPFILFSPEDLSGHPIFNTFLKDHTANAQVDKPPLKGSLDGAIKSAINFYKEANPDLEAIVLEYLPVKLKMFSKLKSTPVDVYLKISDSKHLKVLHKGSDLEQDFVNKYKNKKVEKLYIKNDDFESFINFCMDSLLDSLLNLQGKDSAEIREVQSNVFEVVQSQLLNVGMSEAVIALTKKTVESSLKLIESSPMLADLLSDMRDGKDYVYEHSMLVSYVACGMSDHIDWSTDDTREKLSIAAFMHDITISDQDVAIEFSKSDGSPTGITNKDLKEFEKHPIDASKLVSTTKDFPPDVDKIVLQHHELPLGKGFPRKLSSNNITPLSSLFIVAHKYVDMLYIYDFDKNQADKIIDRLKVHFKSGNFRKALNALITLLETS